MWERESTTLRLFILKGGFVGLLPCGLAIGMLYFWAHHENSLYYYPILTAICLGISLLVFCVLYIKRLFWWERWWASQVYRAAPIPIVATMTISGVLGIGLAALWVFLYLSWGKPGDLLHKGIFAAIYVVSYVCLVTALTLLVIHRYISRLEQHAPQPIFVDTGRLLMVVVEAAIQSLNLSSKFNTQRETDFGKNSVYETLEVQRIPENGGILALIRECRPVPHLDATGQVDIEWQEMLWHIQADRWGHIQLIKPAARESSQVEDRVFLEYGRYS